DDIFGMFPIKMPPLLIVEFKPFKSIINVQWEF
ncbi:hypothetical protein II1_05672, partial [Bacillus cereus MC118]